MKSNRVLAALVAASLVFIGGVVAGNTNSDLPHTVSNLPKIFNTEISYIPLELHPVEKVVEVDESELNCMALNMYFEARNQETTEAMAAVGYTVLNRVASKRYPDSICNVVFQGKRTDDGGYVRNKCQFSWVCDGLPDTPKVKHPVEFEAWNRAQEVAIQVLRGEIDNPVGNATMYHATYVRPYWMRAYSMVAQIEDHIFYEKI